MKRKKTAILRLLDRHRVMALATNRSDGWPQVTLVGYVNCGFLLYCFVARTSQKHGNVLRDFRVSVAIGSDSPHPLDIEGLSLAGQATIVTAQSEFDEVSRLRLRRYPDYAMPRPAMSNNTAAARVAPQPPPTDVVLLRIAPTIVSLVDYTLGFGHSDLVILSDHDLAGSSTVEQPRGLG